MSAPTVMFVCGPDKGTTAEPYRCICCRRTFADIDSMAVSMCWECTADNINCRTCRRRGVFINDERVGGWDWSGPDAIYKDGGGLGHRLASLTAKAGIMACGERIPREFFGQASGVVPWCPDCWPEPS